MTVLKKNVDTGLRIETGDLQNEDHEGRPEETKHHSSAVSCGLKLTGDCFEKNVDTGLRIEKGDLQNEGHEGRPEETKHHNEQRREKGMRQNKRGSVK